MTLFGTRKPISVADVEPATDEQIDYWMKDEAWAEDTPNDSASVNQLAPTSDRLSDS